MGTCISALISLEEIHMSSTTNNAIDTTNASTSDNHAILNIPSNLPNMKVREVIKNGKTIISMRAKWGPLFEDSNVNANG